MDFPHEQSNREAIDKFIDTFPECTGRFREFFEIDGVENMSYLRNICGFKCAACGGYISWPVFKFNHFSPITICYDCQHK